MSASARETAIHGLQHLIECRCRLNNGREEIAKTVEVLMDLLDKYVREDAMDQFYVELAKMAAFDLDQQKRSE